MWIKHRSVHTGYENLNDSSIEFIWGKKTKRLLMDFLKLFSCM